MMRKPHRLPSVLALRIVRPHQRLQLRPRHHLLHLVQKLLSPRLLPVPLETRSAPPVSAVSLVLFPHNPG